MMSLESDIVVEIAEDFLADKEKFKRLGYELIGTKDINEETIYCVKEKSE